MEKSKIALSVALVAMVIAIGGYMFPNVTRVVEKVGADLNTRFPHGLDVTEDGCYAVDGTCVIDENGNFDGAITGTTASVGIFTRGGGTLATSTSGTAATLKLSDFGYGRLQVTPNTADLTYTLPSTSTLSTLVPDSGDARVWVIYNATTTAGIDVIFAAGTGSTILYATTSAIVDGAVGTLEATRKANTDIQWLYNVYKP